MNIDIFKGYSRPDFFPIQIMLLSTRYLIVQPIELIFANFQNFFNYFLISGILFIFIRKVPSQKMHMHCLSLLWGLMMWLFSCVRATECLVTITAQKRSLRVTIRELTWVLFCVYFHMTLRL